jgi:D-lactate dehydrogenase
VRAVAGETLRDWVPQLGDLPGPGTSRAALAARSPAAVRAGEAPGGADAVYFPACIGSLFAAEGDGDGVEAAFLRLCERAGVRVVVPAGVDELCCATVWESKGLVDGAAVMARKVVAAVWEASDAGRLPVVCDATSCTHGLTGVRARLDGENALRWDRLTILDAVTFARTALLPRLTVRQLPSLALHPTCSAVHLGAVADLSALAQAVAHEVTVPDAWGCCGTAGDRGMLHPELTASATEAQAAELADRERRGGAFTAYASCNRTCEMGMSAATGRPYRHLLEVLEEVSRG